MRKRKESERSPSMLHDPKLALLLAARLMRGDSRQIDVYVVLKVKEYDESWTLNPQACRFRWCRRNKRYYSELSKPEIMLDDKHKWRYWFNDWFPLVVADGVPLEAIRIVHELEKTKLEKLKSMPSELKHLIQKRAPVKMDHPVYCPDCRDWLPTVQLRYICPHMLNCVNTGLDSCGEKGCVRDMCRTYNTCFRDLSDKDREELIKTINREHNRKHGWSERRLANKPRMKANPSVWSDPRRYTARVNNYGR